MITPKFSCSQDINSITISLYVPSVRASEVEIHVEGTQITVHINPYFLRLTFPSNVLEDDDSSANYDVSSGYLIVKLTKETKGELFKDLDLLAKLLAPTSATSAANGRGGGIEVVGETPISDGDGVDDEDDLVKKTERLSLDKVKEREILLEAARNDWRLPQEQDDDSLTELTTSPQRPYGFLDAYSGYFKHVTHTENEVNELGGDAEILSMEERRKRRSRREEAKWDEEYYIADYANDEEIQAFIQWQSPFAPAQSSAIKFTEEEKAAMLRLPRREYLPTPEQNASIYITLISVLFSYAYDMRTTMHDPTPESAWTICSLTPCFSALDTSTTTSLASTFVAAYRRALSFPLYRNWELCERCRLDVSDIMRGGRRSLTRALLEVKNMLDKHDVYYVYSKIWVADFVVWTQSVASDENVLLLAEQVRSLHIPKAALGWSIEELEESTRGLEGDSDDEDEDEAEVDSSIRLAMPS